MPPKENKDTHKKPEKPAKKKVTKDDIDKRVEADTFGMKNKNKSKKVQQYITRVEKSVKYSTGAIDAEKAKEAKKEFKVAKLLEEEQLRLLLNEGVSNQFGKKRSDNAAKAAALGLADQNEEVKAFLEELSSDSDSSDDEDEWGGRKKKYDGPIYIDDEPVAAVEVFRERTIEDVIEEQRAKLALEGKKGTPITSETFAKWRASKLARIQAEAEARMKAESTKKGKAKGLSVLSGKQLFNYDSSLFKDDDQALDASEESDISKEAKKLAEKEAELEKQDKERADLEQARLAQERDMEQQAMKYRYEAKMNRALQHPNYFHFLGINVNISAFEEDEPEDLDPIVVETLTESDGNQQLTGDEGSMVFTDTAGQTFTMGGGGADEGENDDGEGDEEGDEDDNDDDEDDEDDEEEDSDDEEEENEEEVRSGGGSASASGGGAKKGGS